MATVCCSPSRLVIGSRPSRATPDGRCREAGLGAERVYWTPGTVDLPRFTGKAAGRAVREEFALGDAPVVVSVARLAPQRGHETLLAGFRGVLADFPAARLLLVGKGET